jgi:1,4-dihydroxy-6-naphthoate synthase
MTYSLAYSPCPNDTFMFDAMVHGRIDTGGHRFEPVLADIKQLNQWALAERYALTKLSFFAFYQCQQQYKLLSAGSALGEGVGPLLVTTPAQAGRPLEELRIAIPGVATTAHLLLHFFAPAAKAREVMLFHEIMPAVREGRIDAGVIIHESRFTYQDYGLTLLQDLGTFWEQQTGLPIPLGGIAAHRSLGEARIRELDELMRRSVQYAFDDPDAVMPYVRQHAQEMSEAVMQQHINLYVNDYTLNMGERGQAAVERLLATAADMQAQLQTYAS